MDFRERIYVAGHQGMAGSALVRALRKRGYCNLLLASRQQLDLTDQSATRAFLLEERPQFIYVAAAKVGGIAANNALRADFLWQNLAIELNLIQGAFAAGIGRLLFLGSSCAYPRDCPQPIREEYLLAGPLEKTNEPYAIAKIAGIKLAESFNRQHGTRYVCAMPTNLYGPGDNYDLQQSHVLPALLRKAHEAKLRGEKKLPLWGSGTAKREFMHVDDMAEACVFLMESGVADGVYNVGVGTDLTIRELAEKIMRTVGIHADLVFDTTKPDGTPRKLLDVSRLSELGWRARIGLEQGLHSVYQDFLTRDFDKTGMPLPSAGGA